MLSWLALLGAAAALPPVLAAQYSLADSYQGAGFLSGFSHEDIPDPTHGRVNYLSQEDAISRSLTIARDDSLIIRADSAAVLRAGGPGRDSVRLRSNKQYTTHVTVWNIRHMPQGCGTWPAVWEVGANWPDLGEIDIVEGVNDQAPNHSALHTGSGCTMPPVRMQTGTQTGGNNCDSRATGNTGCGVKDRRPNSFGPAFNRDGGGFYAMERAPDGVRVWFWARHDHVPADVLSGAAEVHTGNWGIPVASWPSARCDFSTHLGPHWIVINLTFCGDWAGQEGVYRSSGCPDTCISYVENNPDAFADAYFDVAWLKVYEPHVRPGNETVEEAPKSKHSIRMKMKHALKREVQQLVSFVS
ncbi:endo-beta-glucanase [Epithele typhae]|uniref:endo-beta-glucanase n=1 Tax=Epithele typhae TaxID=378194 RepID=UPI002008696F|nr:endo-beta-glucanase [Epithele typhae]KAH9945470.1 endo-beta-glucanase [Epithele typhae]